MSAIELKSLVKRYIKENIPIEAMRTAAANPLQHKVLLSPPHHSDLNPIELAWARIKGNIGRQYSIDTTLQTVYQHLMQELNAC